MIYRIDVRMMAAAREGQAPVDALGEAIRHQILEFGTPVGAVRTARIFLVDTDASVEQVRRIAEELLADPIVEMAELIDRPPADAGVSRIEIHLKPGVMDPVAASTEMAIRDMGLAVREVRTGRAYLIEGHVARQELERIASRVLANGVIESVHFDAFIPSQFPAGREYQFNLKHVALRELGDGQLQRLSRQAHLFLSPTEMRTIQQYFRQQGREPTDVELETLAQTWSEHCVHKTLKSSVDVYDPSGKFLRHYGNLMKETIFASTQKLMAASDEATKRRSDEGAFCLSVFKDNAGVIAFDDQDAVCFKVETHNHPSAIEPYGGSATGIGGVIRDILGTGLGAKPIANTDVFCVAYPQQRELPRGVIHPKRVLQQIVAGVRDYGNRMGIPTVNGAVYFDDRYIGNPLVFCGCVGLIPRDKIDKAARRGEAIIVMGGRTGRDGIHGATFSSAELTDTHADEFSHAVQIGNAITEKKMTDVLLGARDRGLYTAVTDCGAGGLSSAVGEMGERIGASVELSRVPLKYAGLRYDEIWISEAQERMVVSVPQEKVPELLSLAAQEDVEATVIGTFGTPDRELILHYEGHEVGRLSMQFLHEGIPLPTRRAIVGTRGTNGSSALRARSADQGPEARATEILKALAHANVASKHWVIQQYDHEVQGGSIIKPLTGPRQVGPSDAAVLRPKLDSWRGIAIGCGLAPHIEDPYQMAIAAIDEAVRNVVAVGADPARIAILDNFCWPSADDERTMGALVSAWEACRDAALAYRIPFISGKDSLHNQFTNTQTGEVIRIPNTLLISAIAVLADVRRCVTMDLKQAGNVLLLAGPPEKAVLSDMAAVHRAVSAAMAQGAVRSCHDVSDGGLAVAAAEMCIACDLGAVLNDDGTADWFAEPLATYLIEVVADQAESVQRQLAAQGCHVRGVGNVSSTGRLRLGDAEMDGEDLRRAWRGTLDW
jgi:phosphoribosylformylglycinamidine synthase